MNAVEKAMRVLMAFDGSQRHLTLSQIAALTELDLSAAQRFTFTLSALGYLIKDERTRKYELSPRLLMFTSRYLASSDIVPRAMPYLQQLARQTEEAVNLTVLDGPEVVFVQRIVSRYVLDPAFLVGSRLPAYATAPGLAMLATLPDAEVNALLATRPPVAHTRHTITAAGLIRARLIDIRKRGYAHTREEYFLGDFSVAVAILGSDGRAVGAINVAVAKPRWRGVADERQLADLLLEAKAAIEATSGLGRNGTE
ncbi:MAG TPA: IclR family transcriptional regulator [Casimicrobiaceae bacterium]|nr:IclR family transcriptional regulator [Casimicrobiaceae bacterium]